MIIATKFVIKISKDTKKIGNRNYFWKYHTFNYVIKQECYVQKKKTVSS